MPIRHILRAVGMHGLHRDMSMVCSGPNEIAKRCCRDYLAGHDWPEARYSIPNLHLHSVKAACGVMWLYDDGHEVKVAADCTLLEFPGVVGEDDVDAVVT